MAENLPPPTLGTDEVVYDLEWSESGEEYGYWVAMENRSVGTRFPTEGEALAHWHKVRYG